MVQGHERVHREGDRVPQRAAVGPARDRRCRGRAHVVPVAFRYNAKLDAVDIGGHNFAGSKKFRDAGKTGKAAFVVDDVLPPWRVRGVEVRGMAEVHSEGGKEIMEDFAEELI